MNNVNCVGVQVLVRENFQPCLSRILLLPLYCNSRNSWETAEEKARKKESATKIGIKKKLYLCVYCEGRKTALYVQ